MDKWYKSARQSCCYADAFKRSIISGRSHLPFTIITNADENAANAYSIMYKTLMFVNIHMKPIKYSQLKCVPRVYLKTNKYVGLTNKVLVNDK